MFDSINNLYFLFFRIMVLTGISKSMMLIILLSSVSSGSVYFMNSTFQWPGEVVSNTNNDQSTNSYNNVTDNGYGNVNVKTSTHFNGVPGAITRWVNTNSYELLGNNNYQFLLKISFSLKWRQWWVNSWELISMIVTFWDFKDDKQLLIVFSMSWDMYTANTLTTEGEDQLNQNQIIFNIDGNPSRTNLWLYPQSINTYKCQAYSAQFDVIGLIQAAQQKFNSKRDFVLKTIIPRIETNNIIADIDLNVSKTLSQTKCCQLSTLNLSNLSVNSQVLQNVTKPNYCKIFFNGSTLGQVAFGFNFQNVPYGLKSYQFVAFGYLSTKWVTPPGAYQLPLQSSTNAEINVDFAFGYAQSVTPSHTAVCFTVVLRNDYNPNNESFSSTKANPSAEIRVCPWWRAAMPDSKRIKVVRLSGEQFYGMYVSSADWPVFTFISIFSVEQTVRKFNLFDFVEEVRKYNPTYNAHHISCIQMGFRVYSGMGAFTIEQLALNIAIIPDSALKAKSTQCLMQNLGTGGNGSIQCGIGAIVYAAINQIMTTPNLALLLRMVCTLRLIDDLTYYAYHKKSYDQRFRGLSLIAWNMTTSKWVIPQLAPVYQYFNFTYRPNLSPDPTYFVPESYIDLGQDANFLRQTEDFWLSSLPIATISFLLFHCLFVLLRRFRLTNRLSNLFKRFHWFGFLMIAVIGENLQFLSFRCFSQVYQLLPLGKSQLIAIVLAYICLFFVVFYSACSYLVLPSFYVKYREIITQGFKPHFKTYVYLTGTSLLKVCAGMAHSLLYDKNFVQIVVLLLIQFQLLFFLLFVRSIYSHRSLYYCHLLEGFVRVTLHLILAIEVFNQNLKNSTFILFEEINLILIEIIFALSLFDLIISNIAEIKIFESIFDCFKSRQQKNPKIRPKQEVTLDLFQIHHKKATQFMNPSQLKKSMFKLRHKKIKQALQSNRAKIKMVIQKPKKLNSLNEVKL